MTHRSKLEMWAAILAGGSGIRLQEYTRARLGLTLPKQFCILYGAETMLQRTIHRACSFVHPDRIVVTIPGAHEAIAAIQLRGEKTHLAVQPANRDTTAAVFLAVLHIYKTCPDALVVVLPGDHYISPEVALLRSVMRAATIVRKNTEKIVVIGYPPHKQDPDLGFLVPKSSHPRRRSQTGVPIVSIVEKPSPSECQGLTEAGAYWNTFIIIGTATTFLNIGREAVPAILKMLTKLLPALGTPDERRACATAFDRIPSSNFTRDVLSRVTDHLVLVPMEQPCRWLDLGRPERVEEMLLLGPEHSLMALNLETTARNDTVSPRAYED